MESGIFLRGVLVGTRDIKRNYTNNNGEQKTTEYKEIGIEVEYKNTYGRSQTLTKNIRISEDKTRDASFMKSLSDNHLALIELPVNVGDFKSLYVDSSATVDVIQSANAA